MPPSISPIFMHCNAGKESLSLDLKKPEGQAIVHDLIRTADVVMHNQRPGKAEKVGIGYEQLKAINPKLVYCYLPGFGSAGPRAFDKSFAPLQSGFTGLLFEGGGEGGHCPAWYHRSTGGTIHRRPWQPFRTRNGGPSARARTRATPRCRRGRS